MRTDKAGPSETVPSDALSASRVDNVVLTTRRLAPVSGGRLGAAGPIAPPDAGRQRHSVRPELQPAVREVPRAWLQFDLNGIGSRLALPGARPEPTRRGLTPALLLHGGVVATVLMARHAALHPAEGLIIVPLQFEVPVLLAEPATTPSLPEAQTAPPPPAPSTPELAAAPPTPLMLRMPPAAGPPPPQPLTPDDAAFPLPSPPPAPPLHRLAIPRPPISRPVAHRLATLPRSEPASRTADVVSTKPAASPAQAQAPAASPLVPPHAASGSAGLQLAYPDAARSRGIEGTAVVRATVLPDGHAAAVSIERSSGSDLLNQAALQAVRDYRFSPATRGGLPVQGEIRIPIRFRLDAG